MQRAIKPLLSLISGLQTERYLSLLVRHQGGPMMVEREPLLIQQARNEALVSQLASLHLPLFGSLTGSLIEDLAERTSDSFRKSGASLLAWYAQRIDAPLYDKLLALLQDFRSLTPHQISSIIHVTASFAYLARLRDRGILCYLKAEIGPEDLVELRSLAGSFLMRERLFLNLADENLRRNLKDLKPGTPEQQDWLEDVLRRMKSGDGKGVLAESSLHKWCEGFDALLPLFYELLVQVLSQMIVDDAAPVASGGLTAMMETDIARKFPALLSLPLFRGLSDGAVKNLLKGARLHNLEKNETLVSQGEPLSRFMVIVDGWIKLLKTADDGQEAVVHIAGRREPLLEYGTLQTGAAPLTARTIHKSTVLSLPLSNVREQAARNQIFTHNLLLATSARLQKLVSQYEQTTLRTAAQRVGWFLVNLNLDQGLSGDSIKLPFDKSLIASYLNIKPETFSRVLQSFKERGFVINRNEITLPDPHALCSYCEPDMASRCCRAEDAQCAPLLAWRKGERKE